MHGNLYFDFSEEEHENMADQEASHIKEVAEEEYIAYYFK